MKSKTLLGKLAIILHKITGVGASGRVLKDDSIEHAFKCLIRFSGSVVNSKVSYHCYPWFDESERLINENVRNHSKWFFQKDKQVDLLFK